MTSPLVIETFSLVAPLGLCFHDAATGERVMDGLNVSVYPETNSVRKNRTYMFPNRVGVYVLHKAHGLDHFPGGKDEDFWAPQSPPKNYTVEVSDALGRFQSFRFTVELPVRGIYQWENVPAVSPNKTLASIPLYSAPARQVLGGMSVIRAELRYRPVASPDVAEDEGKPASFAVLEARFEGELVARGIAGKDGKIALLFPSLSAQSNPIASPPASSTRVSLADQQWILDLAIKYQPSIFQSSPHETSGSGEENFPDLRLALAQVEGTIWADAGQTEEYEEATLLFGKELILRSRTGIASPPDATSVFSSFLFVSPAP